MPMGRQPPQRNLCSIGLSSGELAGQLPPHIYKPHSRRPPLVTEHWVCTGPSRFGSTDRCHRGRQGMVLGPES